MRISEGIRRKLLVCCQASLRRDATTTMMMVSFYFWRVSVFSTMCVCILVIFFFLESVGSSQFNGMLNVATAYLNRFSFAIASHTLRQRLAPNPKCFGRLSTIFHLCRFIHMARTNGHNNNNNI